MNLAYCMAMTIESRIFSDTEGFNKSNCLDVVKLLVRYGADVNKQHINLGTEYGYPLQNAISEEHSLSLIRFLLDSGANPNLSQSRATFYIPIVNAYSKNNTTLVNLLLDRGANGSVLLPTLVKKGDINFIRRLISKGINLRSNEGAESLRIAAENGNFDIIQVLIENGANINARDSNGQTALSIAYDNGEMEIYDYLIANGAREFEPRQVAQQPVVPAPATSSTTVIVQPPTTAQPAPAQVTPAVPTLRGGRYAAANSGLNITMTLAGVNQVTAYSGTSAIGFGSWQVNGDQLVITFDNRTQSTGAGAVLRGNTYAYTITSDSSFSGNGETWVRTGF